MSGPRLRMAAALLVTIDLGCVPPANAPGSTQATAAPGPPTAERRASTAQPPARPDAQPRRKPGGKSPAKSPAAKLFPDRPTGWEAVDRATITRARALADDYAAFLAAGKTPRRAVTGLIERFADRASELSPQTRPERVPGQRYWLRAPSGDAAAFVVLGKRPIERGARIVVASVDAPRIDLEPRPIAGRAGLTLFDTRLHGPVRAESWLAHPLALYVYARGSPRAPPVDLVIGEADDDPVLVIPDLLPHLARKVQRKRAIDRPERMNAIAARYRRGLVTLLASRGVDAAALASAEASLVPAGAPAFVGVDRALLAGHGHGHRAMAYAALRALRDAGTPEFTAVVVIISDPGTDDEDDVHRASGVSFVKTALSRLLLALSGPGEDLDALATRLFYARSAALITSELTGTPSRGLIVSPRSDDALPRATRRVLDSLVAAGAQYQISDEWGTSAASALAVLDLDAVAVAIPVTGRGHPYELLSILDLHQAFTACTGWFSGP